MTLERLPSKSSSKSSGGATTTNQDQEACNNVASSSPLMDSILKSLAKDQQPQEANNESTMPSSQKDSELSSKASCCFTTTDTGSPLNSSTLSPIVPNNQIGAVSLLNPRSPIPPESLKCNILKAKSLEMGKSSNLLTITPVGSGDSSTDNRKNHLCSDAPAATIVSVVSNLLVTAPN